jgi:hypothetical protein
MARQPNTKNILVSFLHDDQDKNWYPAEVDALLSVQFTATYKVGKEIKQGHFYFYKDRNITWKER